MLNIVRLTINNCLTVGAVFCILILPTSRLQTCKSVLHSCTCAFEVDLQTHQWVNVSVSILAFVNPRARQRPDFN